MPHTGRYEVTGGGAVWWRDVTRCCWRLPGAGFRPLAGAVASGLPTGVFGAYPDQAGIPAQRNGTSLDRLGAPHGWVVAVDAGSPLWHARRMAFEIAVHKLRSHVRITISGSPSLEAFLSMLHLIGIESEGWKAKAVLFDLRGVRTKFAPQEHAEIGLQVAASMAHVERVAALVRPHRYTQAGERVGRRNGLDVRMFVDEATALVWLKDKTVDLLPNDPTPMPMGPAQGGPRSGASAAPG